MGTVISYVYLAKYQNSPGLAIEWVREDEVAIQNNGGTFPSPPGIYYIELTEDDQFYVDPLIDVCHEQVTMSDDTAGTLQHAPVANTTRLFEMPAGFRLYEGTNYTLDLGSDGKPTGGFTLAQQLPGNRWIQADYRYPAPSRGPFTLYPNFADNKAIPGCVLAFGRRNEKGDKMAVVVQETRQPSALEYGGRWGISLDFDVIARDVDAQEEIADQTVIYLWGILRNRLSAEGIEITDLNLGGESEEVYDETGDDYFYNSTFSLTAETEWSVHVPIYGYMRQVAPLTLEQARLAAGMSDEQAVLVTSNIRMLESLNLQAVEDPFFSNRNNTFEMIK